MVSENLHYSKLHSQFLGKTLIEHKGQQLFFYLHFVLCDGFVRVMHGGSVNQESNLNSYSGLWLYKHKTVLIE